MSLVLCSTKAGLSCVMKTVTMLTAIWGSRSGQLIQLGSTPDIKWFLNTFLHFFTYVNFIGWEIKFDWNLPSVSNQAQVSLRKFLSEKQAWLVIYSLQWELRWPRRLCSRGVGWAPVNSELGLPGANSLYTNDQSRTAQGDLSRWLNRGENNYAQGMGLL